MKLLESINKLCGMGVFITFIGVFISFFSYPKFHILNKTFNTPTIMFMLCLIFFTSLIILKPILKNKSPLKLSYSSKTSHRILVSFMLLSIIVGGYFTVYLPARSTLLTEFNIQEKSLAEFEAKEGMNLYFAIDTNIQYQSDINLLITIEGKEFSAITRTTIRLIDHKSPSRQSVKKNNIVFTDIKIPLDGTYNIKIEKESGSAEISDIANIRVYGK